MRFVAQFTGTAPTVNSPGPSVVQTSPTFSDLLSKQGPVNADFYKLINQPTFKPWQKPSPGQEIVRRRLQFGYVVARATVRRNPWISVAQNLWPLIQYAVQSSAKTVDLRGWTQVSDCGITPQRWAVSTNTACVTGTIIGNPTGTFIDAHTALTEPPYGWNPATSKKIKSYGNRRNHNIVPNVTIGDGAIHWTRPVAGTDEWPIEVDTPPKVGFNPDTMPGGHPNPWQLPGPFVVIPTGPHGKPAPDPYLGDDTSGQPSTGTQTQGDPGGPPGKPPGGVKEKKMRIVLPWLNGKISAQSAAHLATEGLDWLECLWKALPAQYRTKPTHRLGDMPGAQAFNPNALVTTPQERINDVYAQWSKIDWVGERNPDGSFVNASKPGALACLVANDFTDKIIGRIAGGAQTEATKRDVILGLLG